MEQFQSELGAFPQNFRDLLIVIDVLNALTDKTKQMRFPEAFCAQSHVILGDSFQFTQDDIDKSNNHFDTTADLQLISFMNKDPLINNSFSDFILNLPAEPVSDSIFYKTYSSLSNIPAVFVQTRAKLFCQLNIFVEKVQSMIDFSLSPEQSILSDKIRTIRAYLLYKTKFQLLNESLEKTDTKYTYDLQQVNFDTVKANVGGGSGENTMFNQAYQQLHENAHITFRRSNEQLWNAVYVGMYSSDAGGPYRDSVTHICSDICSTRLPLFILCPNGRTNSGLNRDRWIPNIFPPNKPIPKMFKKHYRFVGQLMGMAIRRKHYLDLKFPILLWKQLVREQVTMEDVEAIDIQSFTIINEMEKNITQNQSTDTNIDINYLFSSIMSELRFDVVSSAGQTYELVPGGMEIPITAANFKEYCTYYREYRLNEFCRQIEFIRQGLWSIVPCNFLSLFTASELEEAVCGKGQFDVELLKRNTYYDSDNSQDLPHIQRFWTVLSEMFNDEQKKSFLTFVWGRSTLPSRDEDFTSKFKINAYYTSSGEVDKALPRK
ncbi:unnamed protein product [Didymodactylos carnosus]|uniref:HECT domain-containing protein n=1 Tax=Didymodactylos carnosus TaxID=1234261 RepID=A0A815CHL2_9BILA|nr:unnamed protein product [Didymodactylos carnosus]CAF1454761.1 unnamed protein product [Didymodactylos carnosus]CAF4090296.1 unnamed protein product [Didymodactylos carnosus]CAF4248919.1 unnamed protein product [Didymodactylos carnosus]